MGTECSSSSNVDGRASRTTAQVETVRIEPQDSASQVGYNRRDDEADSSMNINNNTDDELEDSENNEVYIEKC